MPRGTRAAQRPSPLLTQGNAVATLNVRDGREQRPSPARRTVARLPRRGARRRRRLFPAALELGRAVVRLRRDRGFLSRGRGRGYVPQPPEETAPLAALRCGVGRVLGWGRDPQLLQRRVQGGAACPVGRRRLLPCRLSADRGRHCRPVPRLRRAGTARRADRRRAADRCLRPCAALRSSRSAPRGERSRIATSLRASSSYSSRTRSTKRRPPSTGRRLGSTPAGCCRTCCGGCRRAAPVDDGAFGPGPDRAATAHSHQAGDAHRRHC